jgi:serine/threonine-protein kinase HipA
MTSECFVNITLPGQTEPVTAGKFVLTKNRQGISLGKFIYGKSYLVRPDAVAFDPVALKLTDKTYETVALKGGRCTS